MDSEDYADEDLNWLIKRMDLNELELGLDDDDLSRGFRGSRQPGASCRG